MDELSLRRVPLSIIISLGKYPERSTVLWQIIQDLSSVPTRQDVFGNLQSTVLVVQVETKMSLGGHLLILKIPTFLMLLALMLVSEIVILI